ncbi:MAG: DUF1573 domain-containing protein [Muribaculaceae bacterium]|nr:DUF1573 domain-containing protein [Muribaculaceae bacterium]
MKKTIMMAALALVAVISAAAKTLEFPVTDYDFGTVSEAGKPVVHEFEFKNVSDEPVAVLSASAQCGCTHPEYPAKPIAPGATGVIKVTFVPAGQGGNVNKDVRVRFRGATAKKSERVTLRLKGRVTRVGE